jgi:hypothetical protein
MWLKFVMRRTRFSYRYRVRLFIHLFNDHTDLCGSAIGFQDLDPRLSIEPLGTVP